MVAEEIVKAVPADVALHHLVGAVGLVEARPERGAPGPRPAAPVVAAAAAQVKGLLRRGNEVLRIRLVPEHRARKDADEVRRVAVSAHHLRTVLAPLLQIAVRRDPRHVETLLHVGDLLRPVLVHAKDRGRLHRVLEKLPDQLLVMRDAVLDGAPLVRPALRRDELAVRRLLEHRLPERADLLERGIADRREIRAVLRVLVMVPEMQRVPRVDGRIPLHPAAAAPGILRDARRPALLVRTEVLHRHVVKRFLHRTDEVKERQVAFGEVRDLRAPIAHLEVDVVVVVARPGRMDLVVPDALQVKRQVPGTRSRDEHVASVLVHERLKLRIRQRLAVLRKPLVRRQFRGLGIRLAEVKGHPPVERAVVRDMRRAELLERLGSRAGDRLLIALRGILALPVRLEVLLVIRSERKERVEARRARHLEIRDTLGIERGTRPVPTALVRDLHRLRAADDGRLPLPVRDPDGEPSFEDLAVRERAAHDDRVALNRVRDVMARHEADLRRERTRLVDARGIDEHVVGTAREDHALVTDAAVDELGARDGLTEVERTRVVRRLSRKVVLGEEVAERLVGPKLVLAGCRTVRIAAAVPREVRSARPERDLVQVDAVSPVAAEDRAAEASVADRQALRLPGIAVGDARQVAARRLAGGPRDLHLDNPSRLGIPQAFGRGKAKPLRAKNSQGQPACSNGQHQVANLHQIPPTGAYKMYTTILPSLREMSRGRIKKIQAT